MNLHCKFSKRWLSFKIQFKIEFLLSSTVRILQFDWLRAFLIMPYYKLTNHLLQFLNRYLYAKNQIHSFAFSWDIANLRILWSDWLWAFWLISRELELSHIWDLCRHKANNIKFHLTLNPEKSNDKTFGKAEKTLIIGHFDPNLPIFVNKNIFLENWSVSF